MALEPNSVGTAVNDAFSATVPMGPSEIPRCSFDEVHAGAVLPADADGLQLLVELVRDEILAGSDVVLSSERGSGRAMLDLVASSLAATRTRVLRVDAAAEEPGVMGLVAQTAGRPDSTSLDDQVIGRSFHALTALDDACERVVLLVSDAHLLGRAALRYVQFACSVASSLRLVLAGRRDLLDPLNTDEFEPLHTRLASGSFLTLPAGVAHATPAPSLARQALAAPAVLEAKAAPSAPALSGSLARHWGRRSPVAWASLGLGAAAMVVLAVWSGEQQRERTTPSPPTATLAAQTLPRSSDLPLRAARETQPSGAAAAPVAGPGAASVPSETPHSPGTAAAAAPQGEAGAVAAATEPSSTASPPIAALPSSANPGSAQGAAVSAPQPRRTEAPLREARSVSSQGGVTTKRSTTAQPRAAASGPRATGFGALPYQERDYQYAGPSYERLPWRSAPAAIPPWWGAAANPYPAQPYIGTYTTDANGVRMFRFGP